MRFFPDKRVSKHFALGNRNTACCPFKKPAYQRVSAGATEPASKEKFFKIMDVSRVQSQRRASCSGRGISSSASRLQGAGPAVHAWLPWSTASSEVNLRGSKQKIVEVLVVGFLFRSSNNPLFYTFAPLCFCVCSVLSLCYFLMQTEH